MCHACDMNVRNECGNACVTRLYECGNEFVELMCGMLVCGCMNIALGSSLICVTWLPEVTTHSFLIRDTFIPHS